jgi:capsular exopolysaccharide synthesis family protein
MSKNYEPSLPSHGYRQQNALDTHLLTTIARSTDRPAGSKSNDDSDFDLIALVQTLRKRRVWIFACTATTLAVAALVCIFIPRVYKAESKLEILKQDAGGLSLNDSNPAGGSSDALDFNVTLQTQLAVLKSDTLAEQVIKELNLADSKEFSLGSPINSAIARYLPVALREPTQPERAAAVLKKFKKNLSVESLSGTRLIAVSYSHSDPAMAAKIINQLLSDFIEYNFQVRYEATTKATDWLGRQLVDLKSQAERSQDKAVQLEKESGIFGQDEHHNVVVTRLEQLGDEVTAAETNRVVKENIYRLATTGNPDLVAGMLGANEQPGSGAANSVPLLNSLRQREADLNAEYADAAAKYGPEYPRLIQIKDRQNSLHASIQAELDKVVGRAKSEYTLAASHEASAKRSFAEQKRIAAQMNDKATDFLIAKHEAEASRVLYEHLLGKLKEAGVLAGLHSGELHVVDPASGPVRPARPNVPLYLAFGALAGMTLGTVCVFVAEAMDRTIRSPEEIEATTYVPVLGVIPDARLLSGTGRKGRLKPPAKGTLAGTANTSRDRALSLQDSATAEAFRAVRTALLLSRTKVLMVTSGSAQEGKSFTSLNLAIALAQNGSKVLLVDADLRRGTLSRVVNQYSGVGLSQILSSETERAIYRQIPGVPGLTFVAAGAPPASPSELLGSRKTAAMIESWRQQFDFVLIDTPPLLPVTDAAVLAPNVDAVIVVVRFGVTIQQSVVRTIRILRDVQANLLGVLVNAVDLRSPDYFYYSGPYGYESYHEGNPGEIQLLAPEPIKTNPKGETA